MNRTQAAMGFRMLPVRKDKRPGEICPGLFRQACKFWLEDMVSNRRDNRYCAGRSPDWINFPGDEPRQGCTFLTSNDTLGPA